MRRLDRLSTALNQHPQEEPGWQARSLDELARLPLDEAVRALDTDRETGLTAAAAAARLQAIGPNDTAPTTGPSWPRTLLRQFTSKLTLLLIVATVAALLLGEWLNAAAIGVTVLVTGLFGFLNEYRSEQAIAALRRLTARTALVIRDGLHEEVAAATVVPGDLFALAEGDTVPADARVVISRGLLVNESILTGEPEAIAKAAEGGATEAGATPTTGLFAGTTVAAGSGTALAVATGTTTRLGSVVAAVEGAERTATPLETRLERLGNQLIALFLALCVVLVVAGLLQGRDARLVVEMAVSLAIGAVPEGLPAVATTALAVAVRRLAGVRVLVRRLDAVETLGSTTVIVSDKTGTLTENRMTLRRVLLRDGRSFTVRVQPGPETALQTGILEETGAEPAAADLEAVRHVVLLAALCSDAVVEYDTASGWHGHGDPSEAAILLAAKGFGPDFSTLLAAYPRLDTVPFTSATRMMATTHLTPDGERLRAIKGAYAAVEAMSDAPAARLRQTAQALGGDGYRVLAVAEGTPGAPAYVSGAVVLEDPLRQDAAQAVAHCQALGVRVILATGDQLTTAARIGRETGIMTASTTAVTGEQLDLEKVNDLAVLARATHAEKEAVVHALQERGDIVAMTGDGVNDAAALRAANVGIAVGPNATDVAVEAADIVLSDGRLASLVDGIAAGRQVARSLQAALLYLFTASFGTILLVTLSIMTSRPLPLAPLQILWLNLVVHIFPALALATGAEPAAHTDRPTRILLANVAWIAIGWRALTVAWAALAALIYSDSSGESLAHGQTLVFLALALGLVGQVFLVGVQSSQQQRQRLTRPLLWLALAVSVTLLIVAIYTPGLDEVLKLQRAGLGEWGIGFLCAAVAWCTGQLGALAIEHRAGLERTTERLASS